MAKKNLLGFAQARTGDANPMWGALAAGAIGTGTAIAIRATTGLDKHAELIGMGAGAATGLALMMSPTTRAAGFTGLITALFTNGLRYAEALLSPKQQIKDLEGAKATFQATVAAVKVPFEDQLTVLRTEAQTTGFGIVSPERRTALRGGRLGAIAHNMAGGLGAVAVDSRTALQGGMGAFAVDQRTALQGSGGMGIVSPEVLRSLGGTPVGAPAPGVQIVGGQGFGSNYGATTIGGGRS